MTGAVDLSGLKQRSGDGGGGRPGKHSVEITEANFEAEVLVRSSEVPVVVLLWSPRSQACVSLLDGLDALATADAGKWSLATVNVDAAPRVGAMFGVEAVPTVVALAGGQPLASFEGPQPPDQLRRWIDSLLSATAGKLPGSAGEQDAPVDPALVDARDKLDSGDFVAAAAAYRAILASRPGSKAVVTDVCVPISALSRAVEETRADIAASGLPGPILGHVGDGNFHAILLVDPAAASEVATAKALATRMAERALALGGTITGEHGVGFGKLGLMAAEHGAGWSVMGALKRALDPMNLMNPGKVVPDQP